MYAFSSNVPAVNCPFSDPFQIDKLSNTHRFQSFLVSLNQIQASKNKNLAKNFGPKIWKKKLGYPLPFFKILVDFSFAEFLTFDGWNCLRVTNNCFLPSAVARLVRISLLNWSLNYPQPRIILGSICLFSNIFRARLVSKGVLYRWYIFYEQYMLKCGSDNLLEGILSSFPARLPVC